MSGPSLGVPGPPATGYFDFVRNGMNIKTDVLPDNSPWIPATYNLSLDIVNINLAQVPQVGSITYPSQYALAVYYLGGDRLIALAQDVDPPVPYPGSNPPVPYFEFLRNKFHIDSFISGVITYSMDVTTAANFQVPEWAKNLTLGDLENLKTPWGRLYMGIAQAYGPTVIGIT